MKRFYNLFIKASICLLFLFSFTDNIHSQTCSGALGAPIFTEDYGSGVTGRVQLGATGTSTYCFDAIGCSGGNNIPNLPNGCTGSGATPGAEQIDDNEYAIVGDLNPQSTPNTYNNNCSVDTSIGANHPLNSGWHNNIEDHTPGDTNGGMAIFNASLTANEFYRRTVTGLCGGTTFEFAAWLANIYDPNTGICGGTGLPVNVRFEVRHPVTDALLGSTDSGDIAGSNTFTWNQYALTYTMPVNLTSVTVVMRNNGDGGCGNDLAIDDITFRACGPTASVTQNDQFICAGQTTTFDANMGAGFSDPYFQWQKWNEGTMTWDNVGASGASSNGFNTYTVTNPQNGERYRYIAAGDAAALTNPNCPIVSDEFTIETVELEAAVDGVGGNVCRGAMVDLIATIPAGTDADMLVGTAPYTFVWKDPTGATIATHSGITIGTDTQTISTMGAFAPPNNTWSVEVTDANGCMDTDDITITYIPGCSLPVEFLYFNGQWEERGKDALLTWGTATEQDNDKFELERKLDNQTNWTNVGEVKGAGTTTTAQQYSFNDAINTPASIVYYRLKQFDFDGSFEYSNIVILHNKIRKDEVVVINNPDGTITVTVAVDGNRTIEQLQVYNSIGQLVNNLNLNQDLRNGGVHQQVLSLSGYPSGIYIIRIVLNDGSLSSKAVKF